MRHHDRGFHVPGGVDDDLKDDLRFDCRSASGNADLDRCRGLRGDDLGTCRQRSEA
jgi:hypothetical protein